MYIILNKSKLNLKIFMLLDKEYFITKSFNISLINSIILFVFEKYLIPLFIISVIVSKHNSIVFILLIFILLKKNNISK